MPAPIAITRDVTYRAATAASAAKQLDIYHADASRGVSEATLVYLHGGGWRAGSREHFEDIRQIPLARAGVDVLSASYTLTGEAPFPASVDDIDAVVDWIREHGSEHGLNTERIVLSGASAGGHLVAIAALRAAARGDRAREVDGVIAWFPGVDILGGYLRSKNAPRPPAESFEGRWAAKGEWPPAPKLPLLLGTEDLESVSIARALELDPRFYLDQIDPSSVPPFLILTGSADYLAGANSSGPLLHDALSRVDADVQLLEVYRADHEDAAFGSPVLTGAVRSFVDHAAASARSTVAS